SISRSLQRAETLLRSTFNPSLKWLFHSRSLEDCEDQQEEGNFVAACNLVSRSSAPLLRLQQVVVNVAPQWHLLNRTCTGAPQVTEDAFVPLPSFCAIQGHYRALWRLLEKRSLLLFIHEYTRRAHLTETFILRLTQLLEDQMRNSQTLSSWVSFTVDLGSLCQELRVHLNHWSCLSSKIHSDCFLKLALAQQTNVLVDIRQTLDLFSLQALVLMEHYVYTILYAVTQTELDCVPREVLQNILVGTELYNLAVEEQRLQHSTTQLRTMVLQQTHALESNLKNRGRHPAAFSIKELMKILAVHHAERAAKQLHSWNSEQTHYMCQVHIWNEALAHSSKLMSQVDTVDQGASTLRTGKAHWTWDKLFVVLTLLSLKRVKNILQILYLFHLYLLYISVLSVLPPAPGPFSDFPPRRVFHRRTVSLALATVHLSTVWVMSKAYQFLSSWSLDRFLLITQGDLKQTESLVMNSNSDWDHLSLHNHSQLLLQQQLQALDRTVCELQTLSSTVLKTFSSDCKRMSGEIFEQTMPSAVHWRPSHRTGIPIRQKPSEYASAAAQAVIGQVLEGVAPLSDDARVQALSITMTAFMEAWMEHILKQKIKFSVQGALQLKQDFDSIREMIQSDRYGLSAELLQRLLSLRVFQQVDYALVCLLQQPQSKPYLLSRAWEPFTHCCEYAIKYGASYCSLINRSNFIYIAPNHNKKPTTVMSGFWVCSLALELTQQEWLDLRIHSSSQRWMLPGLQCFYKSES
uniref:Coiled-coil protein 142 C-terminal domain-containing protein n=1 Tax=Sphaeramia orbicularis TaxID=375764 RepID=A0A672Z2Q9_9TELE